MNGWLTKKAGAVLGSVGAGFIGMASLWGPAKPTAPTPVRMLFTYPITYLEPTLYDDWETVFIGNHIYRRLLPEEDNPAIPAIAKDAQVSCAEPVGVEVGPACRAVRVSFEPVPFTDCAGHAYGTRELRKEFESLLAAKPWSLPRWKRCEDAPGRVCVTAKNTGDTARRLKNVNFRFGWSKRQPTDAVFGSGPYCLKSGKGRAPIEAGALVARDPSGALPEIVFATAKAKSSDFNIALYGSKELLRGTRRNVQAHTPLAYYVVTHPRFAGYRAPWNTSEARSMIADHFARQGVFFPQKSGIEGLVPEGDAIASSAGKRSLAGGPELAIPDYLPQCRELASALTTSWRGAAIARCVDIVAYVQRRVRERRGRWSAFLVGLSPADPGRDALRMQYFSKDSTDSLTYDYSRPEELFYRTGIGQSLVTVDGRRVCDLKPNTLGLGNIFITDLVGCDR